VVYCQSVITPPSRIQRGHFGPYGGRFVFENADGCPRRAGNLYGRLSADPDFFQAEFELVRVAKLRGPPRRALHGGAFDGKVVVHRSISNEEDLNHTRCEQGENTLAALLAKHMGNRSVIATTGAVSMALPRQPVPALGLKRPGVNGCRRRQASSLNVYRN